MSRASSGSGWLLCLMLLHSWRFVVVQHHPLPGNTRPDIILLAPVNGETFSALPIVVSYRITGVDIVEVLCFG